MTGNVVISEVDALIYNVCSPKPGKKIICLMGNYLLSSKILIFLYPEKKRLSSGLQGLNFCREQDILPADFVKILSNSRQM